MEILPNSALRGLSAAARRQFGAGVIRAAAAPPRSGVRSSVGIPGAGSFSSVSISADDAGDTSCGPGFDSRRLHQSRRLRVGLRVGNRPVRLQCGGATVSTGLGRTAEASGRRLPEKSVRRITQRVCEDSIRKRHTPSNSAKPQTPTPTRKRCRWPRKRSEAGIPANRESGPGNRRPGHQNSTLALNFPSGGSGGYITPTRLPKIAPSGSHGGGNRILSGPPGAK